MCLFVCVIDHGVNEGEPVDEQYCKQANEDQFRDPEPKGQYLDQDFPEGLWVKLHTSAELRIYSNSRAHGTGRVTVWSHN